MYRMIASALIALAAALLIGPALIRYLKKLHFGQTIYELGPSHQQKQGTPVMGGLMMAAGMVAASLICHPAEWAGASDFVIPLLAVSLLSMAVGFADDYIKAVKKRHDGLNPWQKIAGQVIVAVGFSVYCYFSPGVGSRILLPFTGGEWDLGLFYIPLMTLLVIFIVNSSNLQDGLDGLLSTVTAVSSSAWAVICMVITVVSTVTGHPRTDTVTVGVFAMSMVGACVGFLRFNRYPARTFMGDTGSMLLGGGTVAMAMLLRQPLLLLLTFFTPIMSSVSVILQRYYFKLTHGKRIFLMSPIHHHFEKKGYSETQIVSMYAGITLILSLIAIAAVCVSY